MAEDDIEQTDRAEPRAQGSREITRRGMLGAAGLAAGAAGLSNFVLTDTSQEATAAAAIRPSAQTTVTLATNGSDQTAILQAAINAAMAPGGSGLVQLNHNGIAVIAGQITLPNDGASPPHQSALRITGTASAHTQSSAGPPTTGSVLDMRFSGTPAAKIDTRGSGHLVLEHITFIDTTDGTLPFIHTTNTTLLIQDCYFFGKTANSPTQDGIILGGTTTNVDGTFDGGFQGYTATIKDNYFNRLRSCVVGQCFANAVCIRDNTIWQQCGGDASHGAIHFDPVAGGQSIQGPVIEGNLFEVTNYVYPIIFNHTGGAQITGNTFWDDTGGTMAYVRCQNNSGFHMIINSQYHSGVVAMLSEDASSLNKSTVVLPGQFPGGHWLIAQSALNVPTGGNTFADLTLTNGALKLTGTTSIDTGANQDLHFGFGESSGVFHFHKSAGGADGVTIATATPNILFAGGAHLYSGRGAPNIAASVAGDYYFRTDTAATANQRIYVATAANTWTGIV
jgi:hypothetical protein